ncbi:MAG: ABC transporter ATP-binding protein [Acidobacteria bacterium]|nr:ABC transporter ATP-binding protein [Acidobacteriota bacterium]
MTAIRTEALSRTFGPVTALDNLTLEVQRGEIFGLVGPDGAGKTTTMRLLTAILEPSAGDAWVAGHHIVREAERIKEKIGYMSQQFGLYVDLTVEENIRFYADIYQVPRRGLDEKIDELLSFSDMLRFRRRQAGRLSGGMKQKLGLCCTLVHTPDILFLDEPTNGVDPVSRRDFWRMLYQLLRRQVTIFVSTAYLEEAERCRRVALLHQGRLLSCGTPAEVKTVMHDTVLEITVAEPRRVQQLLKESGEMGRTALFGHKLHLVTADAVASRRRIDAVLQQAGLPAAEIRPVEPSLEDVFVAVLSPGEDTDAVTR